jgi:hypothetical protein
MKFIIDKYFRKKFINLEWKRVSLLININKKIFINWINVIVDLFFII